MHLKQWIQWNKIYGNKEMIKHPIKILNLRIS
jgi:hypothetical protein